eukprot:s701_g30.t1
MLGEEHEWVILDNGSDMSLVPCRYQADDGTNMALGSLQNCQGGSLQTAGGWTICKDETSDRSSLQSPGKEINIPVEYKSRSFAIKAHVRQVSDVAADVNDEHVVRTVVYVEDEIEDAPMDSCKMTSDGTPFFRTITTSFVDPEQVWPFWPYRTTLIRKFQKDRPRTVVELSRKCKDMRKPFGMIDQFLLTIGFEDECESLTLLGVEPQTLLEMGLVAVDESGDVVFGQEDLAVSGLRDEFPSSSAAVGPQVPVVLPPDDGGQHRQVPEIEAGEEIQATPDIEFVEENESLTSHDDLVVTASSTIKLLRDACRWLGISEAGSKQRMFDQCKKAKELALRRSLIESAQEQYKSQNMLRFLSNPVMRKELYMSEAQREFPTIQCDFYFMEPGKEDAVVALLMVDVWSRCVSVAPLRERNAQTVGRALVNFISSVRDGTVEVAFDNEPVLVAGVSFCKAVRAKAELKTHVSPSKSYDKSRTGVAERFAQTIRGIQKTLLCDLEDRLQATVPSGHPVIQWAALHSA